MFRPMLAAKSTNANNDLTGEAYLQKLFPRPMLLSPKYDGLRGIVASRTIYSRTMKPLPNHHVQNLFGLAELHGLDGEVIVGEPNAPDVRRATMSGVMSHAGVPEARYFVFDYLGAEFELQSLPYRQRLRELQELVVKLEAPITLVPQHSISTFEHFKLLEEHYLAKGYEGVILRDPAAPYKQGRSTKNEAGMVKVKRFLDAEAEVIGWVELLHNENEAEVDELGYTKRSTHQENKVESGLLGAFQVRDLETGVEFEVGGGFNAEQRWLFWRNREDYRGKVLTYKHFPIGRKDKPVQPIFLGFRDKIDF